MADPSYLPGRELLSALADTRANISDLSRTVAPANEAHALARRRAGALGIGLGKGAWAAEPGLRGTGAAGWRGAAARGARRARSDGDDPISVTPGEITIEAAREVASQLVQG